MRNDCPLDVLGGAFEITPSAGDISWRGAHLLRLGERNSSASIGMPIYNAGEALGKLQRSVFLCDYLGRPAFRQEIQRLLSQIESMHTLQRAIHNGPISPRRGRTREQMAAISGALTLLTNVVIAWNAHQYERATKRSDWGRPQSHMRHIAPIAHTHINLKGTITFDLEQHRNPGQDGENNGYSAAIQRI